MKVIIISSQCGFKTLFLIPISFVILLVVSGACQSCICVCMYTPGAPFNIKMTSYWYRKCYCGDQTIIRSSYLHNGISFTGKASHHYRKSHCGDKTILWSSYLHSGISYTGKTILMLNQGLVCNSWVSWVIPIISWVRLPSAIPPESSDMMHHDGDHFITFFITFHNNYTCHIPDCPRSVGHWLLWLFISQTFINYINRSVQVCTIFILNTLEIPQSCMHLLEFH